MVCIYHILFIHPSINGRLGSFYVLDIVNRYCYEHKGYMDLFELEFCLDVCPGVGLLDCLLILFFFSEEPPYDSP